MRGGVTRQVYWSLLASLNDGSCVASSGRSTRDVKCMLLQTGNERCVDIWDLYGRVRDWNCKENLVEGEGFESLVGIKTRQLIDFTKRLSG